MCCVDRCSLSTDWTGSCTQASCLCAYKLPPVCSDSSFKCSQNCGETVTAPGCSNTYTCPTNTCESLGQTTGSVCGVACCTEDQCGVCNGPGKVCGQCGYTGPTGGCDGCGNTWEDVCGEPCGDGSSCACNGSVNACGECNGPTAAAMDVATSGTTPAVNPAATAQNARLRVVAVVVVRCARTTAQGCAVTPG